MAPLVHAGRYDPRFLGVMIRTAGGLGPASFDTADRDLWLPTEMLTQLGTDPFISDVARATVLVHETRHFHDALLYPFGAAVLAARIFAATNGSVLAYAIARSAPGAAIPIPLEEWLHWSAARRAEYLALMPPGGPARVVDLPILHRDPDPPNLPVGEPVLLPDAEIVRVGSQLVLNAYRLLDRYWRAPHGLDEKPVASAAALFEVPGVLAQLAAIQLRSNEAAMDRSRTG